MDHTTVLIKAMRINAIEHAGDLLTVFAVPIICIQHTFFLMFLPLKNCKYQIFMPIFKSFL